MMISIILLLTFLGTKIKKVGAILGGIGFGAFIDEFGKFITSDNDYFYRPTFALIYLVFMLLYMLLRTYIKYDTVTPKEHLINSLELIKDAVISDLDRDEKKYALEYLKNADQDNPITIAVKKLYAELDAIEPRKNIFTRVWMKVKLYYLVLLNQAWFETGLIAFFVFQAAAGLLTFFTLFRGLGELFLPLTQVAHSKLVFTEIAYLISSAVAAIFVIRGAMLIRQSRLRALRMFKRYLLVSIYLVQVFLFYQKEMQAFVGLLGQLFLLESVNFMIDREKAKIT